MDRRFTDYRRTRPRDTEVEVHEIWLLIAFNTACWVAILIGMFLALWQ